MDVVYSKPAGKDIPMLSIVDDGHGMTHHEIVKMISFGHKQPEADDPNRIGRFGIGFKVVFWNQFLCKLFFFFFVMVEKNTKRKCDFFWGDKSGNKL